MKLNASSSRPYVMEDQIWSIEEGDGPLVAAAIHDGHVVRSEIEKLLALTPDERLREEDPFTGEWTRVADTRIVVRRSRFEVDMNRPPDKAMYLKPQDAWGLDVWREGPPPTLVDRSLEQYDRFYEEVAGVLDRLSDRHSRFVVYDLHSYNHRRGGPDAHPENPELSPEVNVGTGTLDRERWGPVADAFIDALSRVDFLGRKLDVRENVKFRGGYFPEWIHTNYPDRGCALAIEFKKFFMDEWTGEPYPDVVRAIREALEATVSPVLDALRELSSDGEIRRRDI